MLTCHRGHKWSITRGQCHAQRGWQRSASTLFSFLYFYHTWRPCLEIWVAVICKASTGSWCPWASATAWPLPLVPGGTYTPVGCSLASAWSTRLQHTGTRCVVRTHPSHPSNVFMWVCCIVSSQYFLETSSKIIIIVTIINIIIRVNNDLPGLLMFILYIYFIHYIYIWRDSESFCVCGSE